MVESAQLLMLIPKMMVSGPRPRFLQLRYVLLLFFSDGDFTDDSISLTFAGWKRCLGIGSYMFGIVCVVVGLFVCVICFLSKQQQTNSNKNI